ncbi:histidinol dehydrogenase [Natronoglycomyces albus]|uniref:Histidinol dehydrogenase n=1 Tax=Natronoglycomyces albus TaxID=2811108 RepID=A0A895XL06_9ACTN|nr:histidinol dehydrogenase [Natronoglycomyces albus]QSB04243.1 histidinol dehydrogenase [Natronoglycomyces albus]
MLRRLSLQGTITDYSASELRDLLPRATFDVNAALHQIQPLLDDIAQRGTPAVTDAVARFDQVELERLRVDPAAIDAAVEKLEPARRRAYQTAIDRVRQAHSAQRLPDIHTQVAPGGYITERYVPVNRVGLYVPGGLAVLASSVIMNAVPAQIAGVEQLAVTSPPQKDTGLPDEGILAVCGLLGLEEVYAVGGPAAVAMFAYGTDECDPVDMICGPGNIYVTAAKRAVRGLVGIDAEAGTTEIAIIADAEANAAHVAADLISQAEHDPAAASVLITDSVALADAVDNELAKRVPLTKHHARIHTALTGEQSGTIVVDDIDAAVRVADSYAAEHLEIHTVDAADIAMRIRNAGAIFVGTYTPVSLGDYCAGSNHILPTGGCARHSSGLSVHSFLRGIHVVNYSQSALAAVAEDVVTFANSEDLPSHGEAVSVRFEA